MVVAYLHDGDWSIVIKWCEDNGIPINPDETTYDPDAMNFVAADSYINASEKYFNGYKESRSVVKNGKPAGKVKSIAVNGVATWTPEDVLVAEKKVGWYQLFLLKSIVVRCPAW